LTLLSSDITLVMPITQSNIIPECLAILYINGPYIVYHWSIDCISLSLSLKYLSRFTFSIALKHCSNYTQKTYGEPKEATTHSVRHSNTDGRGFGVHIIIY